MLFMAPAWPAAAALRNSDNASSSPPPAFISTRPSSNCSLGLSGSAASAARHTGKAFAESMSLNSIPAIPGGREGSLGAAAKRSQASTAASASATAGCPSAGGTAAVCCLTSPGGAGGALGCAASAGACSVLSAAVCCLDSVGGEARGAVSALGAAGAACGALAGASAAATCGDPTKEKPPSMGEDESQGCCWPPVACLTARPTSLNVSNRPSPGRAIVATNALV